MIYDGYAETWGLDRKKDENILCYISRVFNDPILRDSYCVGMPECHAGYMTRMNQHIKTSDETYYFAISTGERNKQREKAREVFKEPMKISSFSLGFDDDVTQSIKLRADVTPLKRRKRQISLKEKVEVNVKHSLNLLDLIQKLHTDNQSGMKIGGIEHLSNFKNSDMNNLMKIDFAVRDWIDDTDSMIPRMGAEFPRISNQYKDKKQAN